MIVDIVRPLPGYYTSKSWDLYWDDGVYRVINLACDPDQYPANMRHLGDGTLQECKDLASVASETIGCNCAAAGQCMEKCEREE